MDGLKATLSFDIDAHDYDDEYLTIDTDTHTININNVSRLFGVQYDGNSKLIKFRIRNNLSDIQKMQDSIVYINWIDSKGVKGQSIAINKTISNDICEFAWKVPFDALKNSGVLHFAVSAVVTKNSSSVIDQKWSTQIASVTTPDGIYIKSYTPSSEEEDRIAQIYNELAKMINKQSENLQAQVNSLKESVETSKEDISDLKDKKITKFYASNQGETHITDSDNGKIQDMKIYGQSKQDGEPSPSNPVEIKNVVNPTIKVIGKNLWKIHEKGYINNTDGNIADSDKDTYGVTDFIKIKKNIVVQSQSFDKASTYAFAFRLGFYDSEKRWIQNIIIQTLSNPNVVDISSFHISKAEYIKVSAPNTIFDDLQIEYGSQASEYEPYKEQSVTLPITLNAIPVSSGGNITINGQHYIADYVDVEKGKFVQMIQTSKVQSGGKWTIQQQDEYSLGYNTIYNDGISTKNPGLENAWKSNMGDSANTWKNAFSYGRSGVFWIVPYENDGTLTSDDINAWLEEHPMDMMYPLAKPIETNLTSEQIESLKMLSTYYPVSNISVASEQLDGYTVFNYPISLANGWNYVKQQLNDNRDYIYDMDLQSAEAYVNSEYAVTLTELEV